MNTLIQQISSIIEDSEELSFLKTEMGLSEILSEDGLIINESAADFFNGLNALIDSDIIKQYDAEDGSVDDKNKIMRYARILAGLCYYRSRDIKRNNNDVFIKINKELMKDNDILNNIKNIGKKNAEEMIKFIIENMQKDKQKVKKLADDIQHYFQNTSTLPKHNVKINLT